MQFVYNLAVAIFIEILKKDTILVLKLYV
jgi:hypothetical protein